MSTLQDGLAVVVVPSDDPSLTGRQISAAMSRRLDSPVTVGAAGPLDDPADLPAAFAEAVACAQALLRYDHERSSALLETLETYFATGQSLATSARRLHVHPNTVTQRLDRVKRLLGASWNSLGQALEVQLALRLHRIRAERGG